MVTKMVTAWSTGVRIKKLLILLLWGGQVDVRGTGDGRRKGGKGDLYDGGKLSLFCYCLSSSQTKQCFLTSI